MTGYDYGTFLPIDGTRYQRSVGLCDGLDALQTKSFQTGRDGALPYGTFAPIDGACCQ